MDEAGGSSLLKRIFSREQIHWECLWEPERSRGLFPTSIHRTEFQGSDHVPYAKFLGTVRAYEPIWIHGWHVGTVIMSLVFWL